MKEFLKKKWGEATVNSLWFIMWATAFILIPMFVFALLDKPYLNWLLEHKWAMGAQIWMLFALIDATMHNYLIKDTIGLDIKWTVDPHVFANIYRFSVWLGLWTYTGLWTAIFVGITFPFFQAGRLYTLRRSSGVEKYKAGWWSNTSNTSTSVLAHLLNVWVRTGLAIIGFIGLFYINRQNLW